MTSVPEGISLYGVAAWLKRCPDTSRSFLKFFDGAARFLLFILTQRTLREGRERFSHTLLLSERLRIQREV